MQNMPTNPAYDMVIHPRENELVVATHGRGIFIADITPLQGFSKTMLDDPITVFDIQPSIDYVNGISNNSAYTNFNGESRAKGSHIWFHANSSGRIKLTITQGMNEIYWNDMDVEAGLNHWVWPFQKILDERSPEELEGFATRYRNYGMSESDIQERLANMKYVSEKAKSGAYKLTIEMNGQTISKDLMVMKDFWSN